jgi:hypothetical protein
MKKVLLFTASLVVAVSAFAQGTVQFNNAVAAAQLQFRVYDFDPANPLLAKHGNTSAQLPAGSQTYGGALLAGTGFTVELWGVAGGGAAVDTLQRLAGTTFRTGSAAGVFNTAALPGATSLVPVPNAPQGTPTATVGTFQVRAWNNLGGTVTSWAAVLGNPGVARGLSEVITSAPLGGTGQPAATDPVLAGMTSFNIAPIPEPSAIALGVLGLGTLMFLRRRKA